jgi:hypothetical protein
MTPTLFDVPNIHNAETCSRNKVQAAILAEFDRTGHTASCYTAEDLQQLLGSYHGIHLWAQDLFYLHDALAPEVTT